MYKKFLTMVLVAIFTLGLTITPFAAAAPPFGHPVFGPDGKKNDKKQVVEAEEEVEVEAEAGEQEAVEDEAGVDAMEGEEEEDGGPPWAGGEHPSVKGLQNAFRNTVKNGASPVAQRVLQRLIEARGGSVTDIVYELEEITEDDSMVDDVYGGEVEQALIQETTRAREQVRMEIKEAKQKAVAFKKLAKVMARLGERTGAEETLLEAAGLAPGDKEVYAELSQLYAEMGLQEMPVLIKGAKVKFDVPPRVKDGRTLVPIRAFAEKLGCTVVWEAESDQVVFSKNGRKVVLGIGELKAVVDGEEIALDVPALVVNGRTMVPLRFVSEALDAEVDFYSESSMIVVK